MLDEDAAGLCIAFYWRKFFIENDKKLLARLQFSHDSAKVNEFIPSLVMALKKTALDFDLRIPEEELAVI